MFNSYYLFNWYGLLIDGVVGWIVNEKRFQLGIVVSWQLLSHVLSGTFSDLVNCRIKVVQLYVRHLHNLIEYNHIANYTITLNNILH